MSEEAAAALAAALAVPDALALAADRATEAVLVVPPDLVESEDAVDDATVADEDAEAPTVVVAGTLDPEIAAARTPAVTMSWERVMFSFA